MDRTKLVLVAGILAFCLMVNGAKADLYDSGCAYKIPVEMNISSGYTYGDYEARINLSWMPGMQLGFDDIHAFNETETGELKRWINYSNSVNGSYADMWIRLDQNLSSSKNYTNIYGGCDYNATNNADDVFMLYDDFEDNSLNTTLWNCTGTCWEDNGLLSIAGYSLIETFDKILKANYTININVNSANSAAYDASIPFSMCNATNSDICSGEGSARIYTSNPPWGNEEWYFEGVVSGSINAQPPIILTIIRNDTWYGYRNDVLQHSQSSVTENDMYLSLGRRADAGSWNYSEIVARQYYDLYYDYSFGQIFNNFIPGITIHSPINTIYNETILLNLNVTANETIDTWWYSLNGASNTTFTPNTTITAQTGSNTLIVYANDTEGNIGSDSVSFTVAIEGVTQSGQWYYINRFNDTLTEKNITFSSNVTYISMPKNASYGYFANSSVTITGYQVNSTAYRFDQNYSLTPGWGEGIDSNGTNFFVVFDYPGNNNVSRYDSGFNREFSFTPTHDSDGIYLGIAYNGTHYFVGGGADIEIGVYDDSGSLVTFYDVSSEIASLAGMDTYNNMLYVIDYGPDVIHEYHDNGTYTGFNFDVTSELTDPTSVTYDGTDFYVLDSSDGNVYVYNSSGNYTNEFINLSALYPSDFNDVDGLYFNRTEIYVVGSLAGGSTRVWEFDALYPTNLTIDTGDDGINDFNMTGIFYYSQTIDLNSTAIQLFLSTCTADADGFCDLPLNATSSTPGIVQYSNLNLTYTLTYPLVQCGGISNTTALNMTAFVEDNNTIAVLSNWEAEFDLISTDFGFIGNVTFDVSNRTSLELCVYPPHASFTIDGTVKYTNSSDVATDYSTRYYFFQGTSLDNVTDDIYVYLLPEEDSNQITFIVKNIYNALQPDIIVKATRFFVSADQYRQVDMGLTDFAGEATMQLKLNEWYVFILEQDGVVLRTLPQKFLTSTDDIEVYTATGTYIEYFEYYDTVAASCAVNKDTSMLICTFSDTSGKMVQLNLTIERKQLVGGFVGVCSNTTTASSGTISCSYLGYNTTELHYRLTGRFCCSEVTFWTLISGYIMPSVSVFFGLTGVVIMIFILITAIMFGYWNPVIPIIMGVFALIIGVVLHLIVIPVLALGSIAIAGGIIAYKMRT